MRQVGQTALYKRGNIMCTSETAELFTLEAREAGQQMLKLELDKLGDKVQVIEKYSAPYFALCSPRTRPMKTGSWPRSSTARNCS